MNYSNIADAVEFYRQRGYVYLEDVPWLVGHEAYYATKPAGAVDVQQTAAGRWDGFPVASAEQSFIQMMLDGQPIKRAVAVTPCYRAEPRIDTLHRPYFVKAELINAQDVDEGHLVHMVHDACSFFERFFSVRVVAAQDPSGGLTYDIVEKGTRYELGSYGIRRITVSVTEGGEYRGIRKMEWIYGTACAEPRLSTAIQRHSRLVGR